MHSAEPVIIIRKKSRGHGGHHGGSWKVAYADFVTAMMALFIVLWLLSSSDQVKKAVGGYFMDPKGSGKLSGSSMAGTGESLMVHKDNMDSLKKQLEQAVRSVPELKKFQEQVRMTVTGEGLRIELLENEMGVFFGLGNPKPNDTCMVLLRMLGEQLGRLPNKLVMEGHTDAKPYAGKGGYTNWNLSSDRATAALLVMQASGVRADQVVQVRGFADQQPFKAADPLDASNRRISVIVQYANGAPPEQPKAGGHGSAAAATGEHGGTAAPSGAHGGTATPSGEHGSAAAPSGAHGSAAAPSGAHGGAAAPNGAAAHSAGAAH